MSYTSQYSPQRRNPTGLAVVVGLHVAFIWALASGLKFHLPLFETPGVILGEVLPQEPRKPLEEPVPVNTTRTFTVTETKIGPIPLPEDPVISQLPQPEVPGGTGGGTNEVVGHEPVLADPTIDPRSPLTQPPYPPAAIRAGAQGALALQVLVGADGRVHDARVLKSSGFAPLDQAAVEEARRHWKLHPATRDGVPFEKWYTLRVVFHLENR